MGEERQIRATLAPMPLWWRLAIAAGVVGLAAVAFSLRNELHATILAGMGLLCFFGIPACLSANLRAVNWRTIGFGIGLQFLLVIAINVKIADTQPGRDLLQSIANAITTFISFTGDGARFVFGPLADPVQMDGTFGENRGYVFAFMGLPAIVFVSSFFSVLYYLGVLQVIVRLMARGMMYLMNTSGAESLSAAANVFMGQTEAPLIIKPYVEKMTQSELLAVMVGGMATISGGLMAVYIGMHADAGALLATSVMAAPCSLYLSKLLLPETEQPQTAGKAQIDVPTTHRNVLDAAAAGASDGMALAINVAAMLIAFLAGLAMINFLLGNLVTSQSLWTTLRQGSAYAVALSWVVLVVGFFCLVKAVGWILPKLDRVGFPLIPTRFGALGLPYRMIALLLLFALYLAGVDLSLRCLPAGLQLSAIFSWLFAPAAVLLGIQGNDIPIVADLLGTKLAANEFVAFADLTGKYKDAISPRAFQISTYALTGFANFGSIGIQIGGIGALAPSRRADLARLGGWALLIGFLATMMNAAIANLVIPD